MKDDKLIQRMTKIVARNGRIILKSKDGSGSYMHQHTNIAAGALGTVYTYQSKLAMVFADMSVAHSVARILGAKVVVLFPKKKSPAKELFESTGMAEAICNLINRKLDEMEDAEPKNEFDQAEDLIDRAEAARNLILRNHKVSDETKQSRREAKFAAFDKGICIKNAVYQPIENHCNKKSHNCHKRKRCACLCAGCREFNF